MTDKIVLNDVLGTYDVTNVNSNFDAVATELNDKVFYRDPPEGASNEMKTSLDMNGNRIFNLPAPIGDHEPARKIDLVPNGLMQSLKATAVQHLSGNGTQTVFTLTNPPDTEENTQIYVSGVYQQKDTYSLSGTNLTFSEAPPTGTNNIEVVSLGAIALELVVPSRLKSSDGSTFIGYDARLLSDKLDEHPSLKDKGAIGDGNTDDTTPIQTALTGHSTYVGEGLYSTSTPLKLLSLSYLYGSRPGAAITGNVANVKAAIKRTNNTPVSVVNFETGISSNIDCVAYIDPTWIDNGVSYPQKTTLERITLQGNPSVPNGYGLYIEQGGGFALRDVDIVGVVNAVYAKDAWLSVLDRVHTNGKIVWASGTSVTFTGCQAGKGYSFASLIYSVMNGCGSDGATDTAYRFVNSKITLNGCGAENATGSSTNTGTAIAFDGGNDIVLNNFNVVPKVSQTEALYSVGSDNNITFNQGSASFSVSGVNCADVYVSGNNSTVVFNNYKFWNGSTNNPTIQFSAGVTTSKIIVNYGTNSKIYTSDGTGVTLVETKYDSGNFTPVLSFGGTSTGMVYTAQSGTWQKNGKVVTVSGRIALSSKGTSTGVAVLSGWPFKPLGDVQINFALVTGITGGPVNGTVDLGGTQAVLSSRTATGDPSMAESNFTNTTLLRFSFTFTIA